METLIINGSPHRAEGNTGAMVARALKSLRGNSYIAYSYGGNISPCRDCGYCKTHSSCALEDDMTGLYSRIIGCDRLILASPLYFSQYTGSLLCLMSRLQMLWAQRQGLNIKQKKGLVFLNGGGSSKNLEGVMQTTRILMRELNCSDYRLVTYVNTDELGVACHRETLEAIDRATAFLNS